MYFECKDLGKRYPGTGADETDAVRHVSFGIPQGELVALLGPSGSGKTTLLRMIAGLEIPTSGEIWINGTCVNGTSPSERRIGFVFQNYALFRYMTVYDNVAFGMQVARKGKQEIDRRVRQLLELTGLSGLAKRFPNQLSGGQRQRVAFARALATEPALLLLDEPFAAIDAKVRKELRGWLRDMIHEVGITSIFVTHDQEEAVDIADRIAILQDGTLEQIGSPYEIYKNPSTAFTATFMGDSVVLDELSGFRGFPDIRDGRKVVIRPEYVEAFRDDNPKFHDLIPCSQEGTVQDMKFRGSSVELTLLVNGHSFLCRRSLERRPVAVGETMRVLLYRVNVYDKQGASVLTNQELNHIDIEFL